VIVVDTSALIAIIKKEPDAARFERAIGDAEAAVISAVSVLEAAMVVTGRGPAEFGQALDMILDELKIAVVPFDAHLAVLARDAFVRFGEGRHPAGLNMGDCASYALARANDLPLLFKGNDFSQTDVRPALA